MAWHYHHAPEGFSSPVIGQPGLYLYDDGDIAFAFHEKADFALITPDGKTRVARYREIMVVEDPKGSKKKYLRPRIH